MKQSVAGEISHSITGIVMREREHCGKHKHRPNAIPLHISKCKNWTDNESELQLK